MLEQAVTRTPKEAAVYFKTAPGSYGAHDRFLGVTVPNIRKIAKTLGKLSLEEIYPIMISPYNEERFLALVLLIDLFDRGSPSDQEAVYDFYQTHMDHVNNWNLVDLSAHRIVGAHLMSKEKAPLFEMAGSNHLWKRRIAMVATWFFIGRGECAWTFQLAKILLHDPEDLMHKAVGWMLREAGKKDLPGLKAFLNRHKETMPRTMLRYAIERFSFEERHHFMHNHSNSLPSIIERR